MKKLLTVTLALAAISGFAQRPKPGGGLKAKYSLPVCTRPAYAGVAAHNEEDRCHGDWNPTDNTDNWKYEALPGPDHMVRKNGKGGDRPCTKCPNGGTLQQNARGQEDWCVKYVAAEPGWPASTVTPSCPSGFTLIATGCYKPGVAGVPAHDKEYRCHGVWNPTDNTNNWKYEALRGADHMVRKNGKGGDRFCTKCPNGGILQQDAHGLEDWCVGAVWEIAPVPESIVTPSCPSGFTLVW